MISLGPVFCLSVSVSSPKPCSKPTQNNPFECYRDPVTGRWQTIRPYFEVAVMQQTDGSAPVFST